MTPPRVAPRANKINYCRKCKGTGVFDRRRCLRCNGTGHDDYSKWPIERKERYVLVEELALRLERFAEHGFCSRTGGERLFMEIEDLIARAPADVKARASTRFDLLRAMWVEKDSKRNRSVDQLRAIVLAALMHDSDHGTGAFGTEKAAIDFIDRSGIALMAGRSEREVFERINHYRFDGDPRVHRILAKRILAALNS